MSVPVAMTLLVLLLGTVFGLAWWFGRPRPLGDIDTETDRMARMLEVEALGEAQWLSQVSELDIAVTRSMAVNALESAAFRLKGRKL